jgi:hypothetical protein
MALPEIEPMNPEAIDGGLGGAAALPPGGGVRQVDEEAPGAGRLQERAEQHEREHHGGGDAQRQAEDPLLAEVEVADDALELVAAVGEDPGQELASHGSSPRGPAIPYSTNTRPMIVIVMPITRRAASSSTTIMMMPAVMSAGHEEAGAGDDRVEVDEQVAAAVEGTGDEGTVDDPADGSALAAPDREGQERDQHDDEQVEAALIEEVERAVAGRVELERPQHDRQERDRHRDPHGHGDRAALLGLEVRWARGVRHGSLTSMRARTPGWVALRS